MNESKPGARPAPVEKLSRKIYERELAKLHEELVLLQKWVVKAGQKVCVVFEGRDGAGKGGTIKAITQRVSPRVFHVIALPAPTVRVSSASWASARKGRLGAFWKSSLNSNTSSSSPTPSF